MAKKFAVKSNLIDGRSTKRFSSIESAAEWVKSMEDFGEDGRRSWGIQGEFGTHEFVGFSWSDIDAVFASKIDVEVIECAEWSRFEWDYEYGGSAQMWAHKFNIRITSGPDSTDVYDVKSVQGRFQVEFIEYSGPDDFCTSPIGTYRSMESAVDACRRHYSAQKADPSFVNDAFWQDIAERRELSAAASVEIPF